MSQELPALWHTSSLVDVKFLVQAGFLQLKSGASNTPKYILFVYGCFYEWGILLVGVLLIRAPRLGSSLRPLIFVFFNLEIFCILVSSGEKETSSFCICCSRADDYLTLRVRVTNFEVSSQHRKYESSYRNPTYPMFIGPLDS